LTLRERIEAARELLQEAGWPQVWAPTLGFIDPRKVRGSLVRDKGQGQKTRQKLHPKDEPREQTFKFPLKHLNYKHPPYLEPDERAPHGTEQQGAAPIGSWP
jgi:hypothetical protein